MKLNKDEADEILNSIIDRTKEVLLVKAKEYIRNEDFMHNFNIGAKIKEKLREEVIEDFRLKHEISRMDLINDMKEGKLPTEEYVSEKYGDIINYYILEEMSIKHKIRENER